MEPQQTIDALRENIGELQRLHRIQRLQRVLKYVLVGSLIGRDVDRRILDLTIRNKQLVKTIVANIDQFDSYMHAYEESW